MVADPTPEVNRETFAERVGRMAAVESRPNGGELLPGQDVIVLHDPGQDPVAKGDVFPFGGEYHLRVAMVSGHAAAQQLVRLVAEKAEVPS